MALQTINTGTFPNDTTGTPAQTAFKIINANFAAVPNLASNVVIQGADSTGATDSSAAFQAAAAAYSPFFIPPGTYLTNTALTGTYSYIAQGNPTFNGANPVGTWIPAFGGALQVVQTGTYNSFVAAQLNNLPANSVAQPTAITAYGRSNNAGNLVFGLFGRADLYATTGCATNEVDSFNWSGVASTNALPPNRGYGTTQNVTVAWTADNAQITCDSTYWECSGCNLTIGPQSGANLGPVEPKINNVHGFNAPPSGARSVNVPF